MPMQFGLQMIDGLEDDLAQKARQLERLVGEAGAKTRFKAAMKPITQDAKARIHSITGGLKDSVETRVNVKPDEPTEIEVGISYKRHIRGRHAHLVEGGHKGPKPDSLNTRPHPFWEPAVRAHYKEAQDALVNTINELIDEMFS